VKYLAGGTDGEQLADALMEKEEECRSKDRLIYDLQEHAEGLKDRLEKSEEYGRAIHVSLKFVCTRFVAQWLL